MPRPKIKPRSRCPIAASLDLLGDRWSLVIVRDMLVGKSRFADFLASSEKITSSVLAERLERLEQSGIVSRAPYQTQPERFEYALTKKGRALLPVLQSFCRWGNQYFAATMTPPHDFMDMVV